MGQNHRLLDPGPGWAKGLRFMHLADKARDCFRFDLSSHKIYGLLIRDLAIKEVLILGILQALQLGDSAPALLRLKSHRAPMPGRTLKGKHHPLVRLKLVRVYHIPPVEERSQP